MKRKNLEHFNFKFVLASTLVATSGVFIYNCTPSTEKQTEKLIYADIKSNADKYAAERDVSELVDFYKDVPRQLDTYIDDQKQDSAYVASQLRQAIKNFVRQHPDAKPADILRASKLNPNASFDSMPNTTKDLEMYQQMMRDVCISLAVSRKVKGELQR